VTSKIGRPQTIDRTSCKLHHNSASCNLCRVLANSQKSFRICGTSDTGIGNSVFEKGTWNSVSARPAGACLAAQVGAASPRRSPSRAEPRKLLLAKSSERLRAHGMSHAGLEFVNRKSQKHAVKVKRRRYEKVYFRLNCSRCRSSPDESERAGALGLLFSWLLGSPLRLRSSSLLAPWILVWRSLVPRLLGMGTRTSDCHLSLTTGSMTPQVKQAASLDRDAACHKNQSLCLSLDCSEISKDL
jgi:hypothetical protein